MQLTSVDQEQSDRASGSVQECLLVGNEVLQEKETIEKIVGKLQFGH